VVPEWRRIAIACGGCGVDSAVCAACGRAQETRRCGQCSSPSKLLLRTDLVAVIPIDGRIGRGIVSNLTGRRLVELSLRALLFFHFALLDALHFFLAFLECRGHKPLLTAECGEGPGPCRPAHPWKRKTTSAVRAAGALTHGNLHSKNGRVPRPSRARRLHRALQTSF